jgi:hypothetical protein
VSTRSVFATIAGGMLALTLVRQFAG